MNILIINQYAAKPSEGLAARHYYLSKGLSELGLNVTLVSASWHHLKGPNPISECTDLGNENQQFRHMLCPTYRYRGDSKFFRVINWFLFSAFLVLMPLMGRRQHIKKPDVVYYSSPSIIPFLGAYFLAKVWGAKLILEVRDIWPASLVELGGVSKYHPLILLMRLIEHFAYRSSDLVVSNLEGFDRYLKEHGYRITNFMWLPNGVWEEPDELSTTLVSPGQQWLSRSTVNSMASSDHLVMGYVGTLGLANAMGVLIDALSLIEVSRRPTVIIVGDGPARLSLQSRVNELGLDCVRFLGRVSKHEVRSLVKTFDICFISWNNKNIYKYGIAANKLFEYMASGKPIIQCYSGSFDPVEKYSCGFTVEAEQPEALARKIVEVGSISSDDLRKLGENGERAWREHHTYQSISQRLYNVLKKVFENTDG